MDRSSFLKKAGLTGLVIALPKPVFNKIAQAAAEPVQVRPVQAVLAAQGNYVGYMRAPVKMLEPVVFPTATASHRIDEVKLIDHRGNVLFSKEIPDINLLSGDSLSVDFRMTIT